MFHKQVSVIHMHILLALVIAWHVAYSYDSSPTKQDSQFNPQEIACGYVVGLVPISLITMECWCRHLDLTAMLNVVVIKTRLTSLFECCVLDWDKAERNISRKRMYLMLVNLMLSGNTIGLYCVHPSGFIHYCMWNKVIQSVHSIQEI